MKYSYIFAILTISIISFSCIKDAPSDYNNPESTWNPNFSMAIGYASLGMNESSGFDTLLLLVDSLSGFPLWFDEADVPLVYTMPFDMEELDKFSEEIINIMFRLNFYNGFPADAKVQVYFLDIYNQTVDSLFSSGSFLINQGTVDSKGKLVKTYDHQSDVVLSPDKIDNLLTVRNIKIQGGINLPIDTALIDYYPTYSLDIQMGLQVELSLNFSDSQSLNNNQ